MRVAIVATALFLGIISAAYTSYNVLAEENAAIVEINSQYGYRCRTGTGTILNQEVNYKRCLRSF